MDIDFEQWLDQLNRENGDSYSRRAEALFDSALAADDSQLRESNIAKSHQIFIRLRTLFPSNKAYLFNAGVTAHCLMAYSLTVECFRDYLNRFQGTPRAVLIGLAQALSQQGEQNKATILFGLVDRSSDLCFRLPDLTEVLDKSDGDLHDYPLFQDNLRMLEGFDAVDFNTHTFRMAPTQWLSSPYFQPVLYRDSAQLVTRFFHFIIEYEQTAIDIGTQDLFNLYLQEAQFLKAKLLGHQILSDDSSSEAYRANIKVCLGALHKNNEMFSDAIRLYEDALPHLDGVSPLVPFCMRQLAECFYYTGNCQQGLATYQTLLQQYPSYLGDGDELLRFAGGLKSQSNGIPADDLRALCDLAASLCSGNGL